MKVKFHEWAVTLHGTMKLESGHPFNPSHTHPEIIDVRDDASPNDLLDAYEAMLSGEPVSYDGGFSGEDVVYSDEEGTLFWETREGYGFALYVEIVQEEDL